MSLKRLVNDKELYTDFLEELDERMDQVHRKLETAATMEEVYKCQGEARLIKSLRKLREKVNNDA